MHVAYLGLLIAVQPGFKPPRVPPPTPKVESPMLSDEKVLQDAHIGTDGPALLEFLRKRTAPAPGKDELNALLAKLGDKNAEAAEKAAVELIGFGPNAVPALRPAANNPDGGDTTTRAKRCLQLIEGGPGITLTTSVIHLIAARKPEGTVEVLLAYLPFAEDDRVVIEVEASLATVALRDGKPDPALVKALMDPIPVRRSSAAGVLCQVGGPAVHPLVRPLLKDSKPNVRLKVTLALVEANDAEAVPVLIDLLAELQPVQRKQAEDSLTQLAGEWGITTPQGNDATSRRLRREMWHAWWRSTDGASLLTEFRGRTPSDADRAAILDLIGKLADPAADVRAKSETELLAMGAKVAPLLRRAVNLGGKGQAAVVKCLHLVEKDAAPALPQAAPRLLALHRPEGTVEALLAYLPSAESPELAQQTRDLIASIAPADPKTYPALAKALSDPIPERRAAAAQALTRLGEGEHLAAVRKLLADKDAEVRLRAALGLAVLKDKQAVPVLIALLAELPLDMAYEAEDYLGRVAGDKAPQAPLTSDPAARAKTRDAWAAWWKDNAEAADLARVDSGERAFGYHLIVESWDATRRSGRVLEIDRAGKARWEVTGLQYPTSAQIIPGERVLIAEQNLSRVTERDFTGKVHWEKQVNQAFHAQRLRNGHTFIAGRNQLIEVDRDGKEVFNQPRFNDSILAATKLRDGQIAFVTYLGNYVRLDANGKEAKNTRLPFVNNGNLFGEVLPNDHVLISQGGTNKVTEYDGDGKVVWQADVPFPGTPTRLPNGHTIVPAQNQTRLLELDRTGKIVHEFKDLTYKPWRVTRR